MPTLVMGMLELSTWHVGWGDRLASADARRTTPLPHGRGSDVRCAIYSSVGSGWRHQAGGLPEATLLATPGFQTAEPFGVICKA
jgi:hypothetical protein